MAQAIAQSDKGHVCRVKKVKHRAKAGKVGKRKAKKVQPLAQGKRKPVMTRQHKGRAGARSKAKKPKKGCAA